METHPEEIRGLTPKLNWMLDHLADDEGVIFLDDDLEYLCRCFTSRDQQSERKVTEARLIQQILRQTAALAAEAGAFFFGWESSESTIRYYSGLVTVKDRHALVRPIVVIHGQQYLLDIRFRMLQPHELAGAQGFPRDYKFTGTKTDQVKLIGNAVPCRLARAIVYAALSQNSDCDQLLCAE